MKRLVALVAFCALGVAPLRAETQQGEFEGIFTLEGDAGRFVPCGEGEAWRLEPAPALRTKFDASVSRVVRAFKEGIGAAPEDSMLPYFYVGVVAEVRPGDRYYAKHAVATALKELREATDSDFDRCGA